MAEARDIVEPSAPPKSSSSSSPSLQMKTADASSFYPISVETKLSSDSTTSTSASTSPVEAAESKTHTTTSSSTSSPNKPSILRNPIHRLRRRKRPSSENLSSKVEEDNAGQAANDVDTNRELERSSNEEEEKELEEDRGEQHDNDSPAQSSSRAPSPKISIVLEHDNEVVVEQLLPFAAKANGSLKSTSPRYTANGDTGNADDLFYSPLKLVSPKTSSSNNTPKSNQLKCKSIIKRSDSNGRSLSSSSLLGGEQRRVTFDEASIVQHESARKRKSTLETIRLAMPIILPYMIAILILVVSSLVPPASTPNAGGSVDEATESVVTTNSTTKRRGLFGGVVEVSTSSSDVSELTDDSTLEDCDNCEGTMTAAAIYMTRTLWTPHSLYDQFVSTTTANAHNHADQN